MSLQTVPRHLVDAALGTARLPLTAAQRVLGPDDVEAWPPTMAADRVAALVRQVTGSFFHDEEMARRGRLEQARIAELREDVRLRTIADEARSEAEDDFRDRRRSAAEQRQRAEERAEEREQQLEQDQRAKRAKAEATAEERKQQVERREQEAAESIERQGRHRRSSAVAAEQEAVLAAERAAEERGEVLETDEELEATRAKRRSGR
ncbi:MAG: hypothetical protein U0Q07_17155 [Acidimicrobiales bacterium]